MAFNRKTKKVPVHRAVCRTADAVAEVVKWARDTGRRFAVHSSGHCFAGHSMHEDLVIGTSRLNRIDHDPDANRITVGAGAFIGHVYEKLAPSHQGLAGGTYGSVCMAGLTLGGGIGYLARFAGLLCDQLEAVTLVDAAGGLVRASLEENPDIFWALRGGGGGSFGIVTELTFRTIPLAKRAIIYVFIAVPIDQARRIVHDWQHWTNETGRETTTHLLLSRRTQRQYLVALTGQSSLPARELERAVQKLLGRQNPIHESYLVNYYSNRGAGLLKNWDETVVPIDFLSKSDYVGGAVPQTAIDELLETLERHPPGSVKLTFEALGGAVEDVPPAETAYPHRATSYLVEYRSEFNDASQRVQYRKAMDDVRAVLKPYTTGGVYVNYPYPDLENWAEAYWGANLPRLMETKKKWDPDNVFRHAQSVPVG